MKALVCGPGDAGPSSPTSPSSLLPLAHLALINGALVQPHSSRELLLALGLHSNHYDWKLPVLCPALFSGKDIITIEDCVKRHFPRMLFPKPQFCQVLLFLASLCPPYGLLLVLTSPTVQGPEIQASPGALVTTSSQVIFTLLPLPCPQRC